ncbi:hypothetical protein E2C01_024317 [Portunus trituberculatus]|uniref:Uncharacterized protein n=1 Tax=Portunus trituberculatus TaxID=210409 RepID=A0A5B7EA71_PORTR|nr:hypothetical protein [Portunus trituberculatus]
MEQCSAFSDILRVPPFTYDVEAWFLHLEAVWAGADLSDLKRYQAVVRALPSEVVSRLYSVLTHPPAITGAFGRSREACFAALNSARYDGGRPSALLARLSALNRAAGFPWSEEMVRHKLSSLLPQPVRLQQQAAVTAGARRNPPLAAVPSSTEARLASVEASLRCLEALLARFPTQTDAEVCFYHRFFGEEARSYRPPCAWPHQGNGAGRGR